MANRELNLTTSEAISWLEAIKDSIHGGDEDYDSRRKAALDIAVTSLKTKLENLNTKDENLNSKIENLNDRTDDLISREDVLAVHTEYADCIHATTFWEFRDKIREIPSIQSKVGKWIKIYDFSYVCSECTLFTHLMSNFCPCCGAKMEGVEVNDK